VGLFLNVMHAKETCGKCGATLGEISSSDWGRIKAFLNECRVCYACSGHSVKPAKIGVQCDCDTQDKCPQGRIVGEARCTILKKIGG
jgi:hypothetical protein